MKQAAPERRLALQRRLADLASELHRVERDLVALGPGERLPGLHLLVEAAGHRALVAASEVQEIVRLVAFAPIPGAPRHALGTFVFRGRPVVALDLASFLSVARVPSLDAHVVVLGGARALGLVVDGVRAVVDAPLLVEGEAASAWGGTRLVAGLCRVGDEALPLLGLGALARAVEEAPA